jgi:hypothetical protein
MYTFPIQTQLFNTKAIYPKNSPRVKKSETEIIVESPRLNVI